MKEVDQLKDWIENNSKYIGGDYRYIKKIPLLRKIEELFPELKDAP